ncbi:MAG: N-formylglutamate amidohydrolase [Syntrophales bacterium]|nr:N-formylglutamate amidohydrolase [Syntrophales bacterium]MCK9527628.1 N-formylglutamate amidohydrolase [Syntrophales bacterium]MDX9922245.1 N-formylglutamate amidohydrolase [Syntrophales bacterium]
MKSRATTVTTGSDILVVVPHSGIVIPPEIALDDLSVELSDLVKNVDWHTQWLYDFRDILANHHIVFPYCSILLDANRDPARIEESVPLLDAFGRPVYRQGCEPSPSMRAAWSEKYLKPFHRSIEQTISAGAELLFDGHSTVPARGIVENQVDIMNFQHTDDDEKPLHYCPDGIVETYAAELRTRLPDVLVTVNGSEYYRVHGHVCAAHSVNAAKRVGARAPAFIQETCEGLFKNRDGTPDVAKINRLRRIFAESLVQTLRSIHESQKPTLIDLHGGRQTYDYDCGAQALQTVMHYYGTDIRGDALMEALETSEKEGTPPQALVSVAGRFGFEVKYGTHWSLNQVKDYVRMGTPVIVLLQAWADRYMTLDEWRREWDHGHYVIAIGLDKDVLLFEDPASIRRTWLREREFLARWHDADPRTGEKYEHFGMVLLGKQPSQRVLEHMD